MYSNGAMTETGARFMPSNSMNCADAAERADADDQRCLARRPACTQKNSIGSAGDHEEEAVVEEELDQRALLQRDLAQEDDAQRPEKAQPHSTSATGTLKPRPAGSQAMKTPAKPDHHGEPADGRNLFAQHRRPTGS